MAGRYQPTRFGWIVEGLLAGMGWPYDLRKAIAFLKAQGIRILVTLNERSLNRAVLRSEGIEYHHFSIPDFTAPSPEEVDRFVGVVEDAERRGERVAVHCTAGLGRTGTMLACYLVRRGLGAEEAIQQVRRLRIGSIETWEQEEAVRLLEERLKLKQRP